MLMTLFIAPITPLHSNVWRGKVPIRDSIVLSRRMLVPMQDGMTLHYSFVFIQPLLAFILELHVLPINTTFIPDLNFV